MSTMFNSLSWAQCVRARVRGALLSWSVECRQQRGYSFGISEMEEESWGGGGLGQVDQLKMKLFLGLIWPEVFVRCRPSFADWDDVGDKGFFECFCPLRNPLARMGKTLIFVVHHR